jgi:hypothetical protein
VTTGAIGTNSNRKRINPKPRRAIAGAFRYPHKELLPVTIVDWDFLGMPMKTALALIVSCILLSWPAAAQETIALAIEGWRQQSGQDGVVYYRCASEICAAGSVVSYKAQPHRTALTLTDFEKHHRGLADHNKGTGKIRDVRLTDSKERTIEGVRVLQISREVDWSDGTTTFTIESRLIGPGRSYSLVSDSPKREWTINNFEGFLRNLVQIAGIEQP